MPTKDNFKEQLKNFVKTLHKKVCDNNGQWNIKGFIDIFENVYTISPDTKVISKALEIHLFLEILKFARTYKYKVILPEHQNHYPDISFVDKKNESTRFAVDFKTTYRNPINPNLCNGFTLGSHGKYFQERKSTKNIRFPHSSYKGHFCLGIIYDRTENLTMNDTKIYKASDIKNIASAICNLQFFVVKKWRIASDKSGSGNTENIGSIRFIEDIINERGVFQDLDKNGLMTTG